MQDFQLTESGDLMFYENNSADNGIAISFHVSNDKGLRISFMVAESFSSVPDNIEESLCITFNTIKMLNNKEVILLDDEGSKNQAVEIRLRTELGDITDREDIGSKLSLIRHKSLFDEKNIQLVKEYILSAIYDIAPEASVEITPGNMTYDIKITMVDSIFQYTIGG